MGEAGGLQTMIFVNAGCAPQSGAGLRPTTVLLTSGRVPTINFFDNTCRATNMKETERDKQSLSWPTQHQGTELPLPLIQWAR